VGASRLRVNLWERLRTLCIWRLQCPGIRCLVFLGDRLKMTTASSVETAVTVFRTKDTQRLIFEDRSRQTGNLNLIKIYVLKKKKARPYCVFWSGLMKRIRKKNYLEHLYYEKHLSSYQLKAGEFVFTAFRCQRTLAGPREQLQYLGNCHITWNLLISPLISSTEGR